MEKAIRITIHTTSEDTVSCQEAEGMLLSGDNSCKITYKDFAGNMNTQTIIQAAEKRMYLTRSGAVSSKWLFEADKPVFTEYYTPFGKMELEIRTHEYRIEKMNGYPQIFLDYDLLNNGGFAAHNKIVITTQEL